MSRRPSSLILVGMLLLARIPGQCLPGTNQLTTQFASNNGQAGNMFDISALVDVTVCSFEVNLDPGTWQLEVYVVTGGGSYMGHELVPGDWTRICDVPVTSAGIDAPSFVPCTLAVSIASGATQGFYVATRNGEGLNYTTGAFPVSDGNITVTEGTGNLYPFGGTFMPRTWNGNVCYILGFGGCPGAPFQINQPASEITFDGVRTLGFQPAVTILCVGAPSTFTGTTDDPGAPHDTLVCLSPLLPAQPGLVTPGGQIVNLPLGAPGCFFLNTLAPAPALTPHPGTTTIPLACSAPVTVSAQQLVVSPASVDGFFLSQGAELDCVAGGSTSLTGPLGDDAFRQIPFTLPPVCITSFPFFGTAFSEMFVLSNGRIMFGGVDSDYSPTTGEAATDAPFVGAWVDLSPPSGGLIETSLVGQGVRVSYTAIPYFGLPAPNTFAIHLDAATGAVTLDGLGGLSPGPAMFLGLSGGSLVGATDPGPTPFATGSGTTNNATDMIYRLAPAPLPVSSVTFTPNGFGNYDWTAL